MAVLVVMVEFFLDPRKVLALNRRSNVGLSENSTLVAEGVVLRVAGHTSVEKVIQDPSNLVSDLRPSGPQGRLDGIGAVCV